MQGYGRVNFDKTKEVAADWYTRSSAVQAARSDATRKSNLEDFLQVERVGLALFAAKAVSHDDDASLVDFSQQ